MKSIVTKLFILSILSISLVSCGVFKKGEKHPRKPKTTTESKFYKTYSEKFGYILTGKENKELITEIGNWLGTPYKYGGCDKSGTDCSCLVCNIYKSVYKIDLDRRTVEMMDNCKTIDKKDLKEGDLVFFKTGSKVSHVGIYISENKFVHSSSSKGVMISDLDEPYWTKSFVKAGKVLK
jgi:cell wall-associated NlpC family hydrolase